MTDIMLYLVSIGAVFAFSMISSITKNGFSINIFLVSVAICIAILVWIPILPIYLIIVSVLFIVGILFSDGGFSRSVDMSE